ncbi:MAG: hypothetical protein ACREN2_06125 [Candidatus Dormibacteria bacterium]
MTLGQLAEICIEQVDAQKRAQRTSSAPQERPATMADVAMLTRLGMTPPTG